MKRNLSPDGTTNFACDLGTGPQLDLAKRKSAKENLIAGHNEDWWKCMDLLTKAIALLKEAEWITTQAAEDHGLCKSLGRARHAVNVSRLKMYGEKSTD